MMKSAFIAKILMVMVAGKISIDKAKQNKLFYFVANVVIYRESDGRCLLLKRSKDEITHPDLWAVPGGKLEWEDLDLKKPSRMNGDVIDFEDQIEKLLHRELKEEAGIEIEKKIFFLNDVTFIRPDEVPVVLVKFAAKYKSGDVVVEKGSFSNYAWLNAEEVKGYKCINGVDQEVRMAIDLFKRK